MSKKWYIDVGNRHLGPFDRDEVKARLHTGKIGLETPIWCPGMSAWVSLGECHDFFPPAATVIPLRGKEIEIELPPDLPALPSLPAEEMEIKKEEELLPSLPPLEIAEAEESPPPFVAPAVVAVNQQAEVDQHLSKERKKLLYWKLGLSIVPLLVLALWWALLTVPRPKELPPGLIIPQQAQTMLLTIHDQNPELKFHLALSADQRKIILASNFSGKADLQLVLTASRGQALSQEPIVLSARADYQGHLAIFSELIIEEGEGIVPGLYQVQIRGIKTSLGIRLAKIARQFSAIQRLAIFNDLDDRLYYKGELLLLAKNHQELQNKLEDFKRQLRAEESKPIMELVERYRAYSAIVGMLNSLFRDSLKRFKGPGEVHLFEQDYIRKIAPLYQSITVENQKIQVSLLETNEGLSREYQRLVEFGRQIGILVTEINTKLKSYRRLKSKNRLELLTQFQGRLNELDELAKIRIHRLQERLSEKQ